MLDSFTDAQDAMSKVKERLHGMMRSNEDFNENGYQEVSGTMQSLDVATLNAVHSLAS